MILIDLKPWLDWTGGTRAAEPFSRYKPETDDAAAELFDVPSLCPF